MRVRLLIILFVIGVVSLFGGTALADLNFIDQIPEKTIVLDGELDDWAGVDAFFTDIEGDSDSGAERDIKAVYLSKDATNIYWRLETWTGNLPDSGIRMGFSEDGVYEIRIGVYTDTRSNFLDRIGDGDYEFHSSGGQEYARWGNTVEGKFPISFFSGYNFNTVTATYTDFYGGAPDGGDVASYQNLQSSLAAPILLTPLDGSSDVSLTSVLTTNDFSGSNSHLKTDWEISTSDNFSSRILFTESTTHLTSLTIPELALQENKTYYWRVKFHDNDSNVSEWSEPFSFTTLDTQTDQNKDGIPDAFENDTVDLDNDGTADVQQETIKSLNTIVGNGQMGVSIKESAVVTSIFEINSIDPDTISEVARPKTMPLGLFSFRLTVVKAGDIANVTIYFSEEAPDDAKWYFHDSINGWVDYSEHTTFSADRKSVSIELKDGGYGDSDGVANGIIVDPSGFGVASWIKGLVSDSLTKTAILNSTVTISNLNLSLNTQLSGKFLSMILPGTYDVSISAPSYQTQTLSDIEISEASIVTKDIALSKLLTQTETSQLYVSIFGRASEGEGNQYWRGNQTDKVVAADTMLATEAAETYFGVTLNDNFKLIEFIYKNTLGKTYAEDPDGIDYWVGELANGKSKGTVIASLINAVMDVAYTGSSAQNQFINKVTVCNYAADTIFMVTDINDLSAFVGFIDDVTHDSTTVTSGKASVDAF